MHWETFEARKWLLLLLSLRRKLNEDVILFIFFLTFQWSLFCSRGLKVQTCLPSCMRLQELSPLEPQLFSSL